MRHKYETRGLVLSRSPLGEAAALLTLLTKDLGIVRARAESVRRSGARLSSSLTTLSESDLVLVRGKEQWRISGAVLRENWSSRIKLLSARERVTKVVGLLLRLVAGEVSDSRLYLVMVNYLNILSSIKEEDQDAAEILVALYIVNVLGLDAGDLPCNIPEFSINALAPIKLLRGVYIKRINHGIDSSGL